MSGSVGAFQFARERREHEVVVTVVVPAVDANEALRRVCEAVEGPLDDIGGDGLGRWTATVKGGER